MAAEINELIALFDEHYGYSSMEYAHKLLRVRLEAMRQAVKFVGMWRTAHNKTEPADVRVVHITTAEEWREVARDLFDAAEQITKHDITCSAACEALIGQIAGALPILWERDVENKRQALEAERDRLQRELERINTEIISDEGAS